MNLKWWGQPQKAKFGLRDSSTREYKEYTGGIYRHVEDGDCAEFAHRPLFLIALQCGIERGCKFPDDGDRPSCAWQRGLFGAVDSLLKDKECEGNGGGGEED